MQEPKTSRPRLEAFHQDISILVVTTMLLLLVPDVNGLVVVTVGALAGTATAGTGVGIIVIVVLEIQDPRPNHPCRAHEVAMTATEVFVVADNVVVSTQPPNQPYFTQEVVGPSVLVIVVVGVGEEE